jgi:hypothetical protein
MILAKPVVANKFWILKKDNQKVGEIEAGDHGVTVKLNNQVLKYNTIRMAGREVDIEFEQAQKKSVKTSNDVYGYAVSGRVHNPVWDVKHRLPLYTKDNNSKSWYAAGWYCIQQHRSWKVVRSPKLIMLQRYKYQGPFHTKEEANDKSVS